MKQVVRSFPGAKTTVITISLCLGFAALMTGGIQSKAILSLALAVPILMLLTVRNYDPDSFEAWVDYRASTYRTERDKLFRSLKALTEAVEADSSIVAPDNVAVQAARARQVLDEITGRYQASAS
jgi:hypothetical protein